MGDEFILKRYPANIFSLSTSEWMKRKTPGGAVMQSYLILGERAVLIIDSPCPGNPNFRRYIEESFKKPVIMFHTHGHVDHIGCSDQFECVFLAKEDWTLAAGGGIKRGSSEKIGDLPYALLDIPDGWKISLGNRILTAYHLPGHTKGSVVLYEQETRILFGGDAVARRILYGMSDSTPLEAYFSGLQRISTLSIDKVYSMHDDFPLPGNMPQRILQNVQTHIETTPLSWTSPVDGRHFRRILLGKDEEDLDYFDFVIPENFKEGNKC